MLMNDPVCLDGDTYGDFIERPEGVDATQSKIEQMRALKASARFLLPPGANGLAKRLRRPRHARVLSGALRGGSQRACPSSGNY